MIKSLTCMRDCSLESLRDHFATWNDDDASDADYEATCDALEKLGLLTGGHRPHITIAGEIVETLLGMLQ